MSSNSKPPRRGTDGDQRHDYTWRLLGDSRAQSVTLGAILVFGVLILGLGVYQAYAVPQQNEEVEFKHNLQAQEGMQQVRNDVLSTGASGEGTATELTLGTPYPTRMVAINPPPASGRIQTESFDDQIQIEHAEAVDDEVSDYWNGTPESFYTKRLSYIPNYHVYNNAPTTVYENSVLYNHFTGTDVTVTGQDLVNGRTISLVALNGTLSESRSDSMTVDVRAGSAPSRTVPMRAPSGENLTITIPTQLSTDQWETILDDQLDPSGDPSNDRFVTSVSDGPGDSVVIEFENSSTYNVKLAKVGVGTGVSDEEEHYITVVSGDGGNVHEDSSRDIVFEVRDRYNNPVSGVGVDLALSNVGAPDEGTISAQGKSGKVLSDIVTGEDGQISVLYEPEDIGGSQAIELRASINSSPTRDTGFDSGTIENATAEFTVTDNDLDSITPGLDASGQLVFQSSSIIPQTGTCPEGGNDACYENISYQFQNVQNEDMVLTGIRLGYITSFDNTGGGGGSGSSSDDVRDGPKNITRIFLNSEVRDPIVAEESSRPHFFHDNSQDNITIGAGQTKNLYMEFDQGFVWGSDDGVALQVTLYFESGLSGTYTIHDFN